MSYLKSLYFKLPEPVRHALTLAAFYALPYVKAYVAPYVCK